MAGETRPYRYLNRDGLWPGFSWDGLELDAGGTLRLMALPRLEDALPETIAALAGGQMPAGIAVDREGTVYFSDPSAAAVYRIDGCTDEAERQPCLGGRGSDPTQMSKPTSLAIPRHRHVLYVADPGNHRIQLFDLDTMALVDIWTGFEAPDSLAFDNEDRLYVVDSARRRVDQFTVWGDLVSSFWETAAGSGRVSDPRAVAWDRDRVYLLEGPAWACLYPQCERRAARRSRDGGCAGDGSRRDRRCDLCRRRQSAQDRRVSTKPRRRLLARRRRDRL